MTAKNSNGRSPSRPHLLRGVKLKNDQVRKTWVLLAPERYLRLNAISVDILQRCDGMAALSAIVDDLATNIPRIARWSNAMCASLLDGLLEKRMLGPMTTKTTPLAPPSALLAELTYRCPLSCPYCSNPLQMGGRETEMSTEAWQRYFLAGGGAWRLHVHLSGGEPAARRDLRELVAHCAGLGLYTNLITSGVGLTRGFARRSRRRRPRPCAIVDSGFRAERRRLDRRL